MNPQLSVIITSYNASDTISARLESLAAQRTDAAFEAIVVDSSTDGTAGIVEGDYPEARLYKFSERKFPGDSRNYAIVRARGDMIAFLDADCTAEDNWVEEILKAHSSTSPSPSSPPARGGETKRLGRAKKCRGLGQSPLLESGCGAEPQRAAGPLEVH